MQAKKYLGQHFLTNPSLAAKIVRLADVGSGDSILEIGAGRGILTEALAKTGASVVAIEKDRELVPSLCERFAGFQNVKIVEGDILQLLGKTGEAKHRKKVIANLPYNIATEIIFRLFDHKRLFSALTLMLQKEVAERIVARPNCKDYGLLSIFSQIHADVKIVLKVSRAAFYPRPKVESAVVQFKILPDLRVPVKNFPLFREVVRASFASRRKMIANSLKGHLSGFSPEQIQKGLESAGISPLVRAEALTLEKFVALANTL
ncbi:MAG: ribosomal RNA small subunit methyltransferase A [Deltaproteobacteria bacterium]|nr:ribosomal RNA small subunit methyltransferase A [Deltaproteobacteria bacterium]